MQAKQGADILAYADSANPYQVFMPDLFRDQPAEPGIFPPDTKEKAEKLGAFFKGPANPQDTSEKVPVLVNAIAEQVPGIEKWGVLGACWGGKVRLQMCREGEEAVNYKMGDGLKSSILIFSDRLYH